jgi:hypothetical protein
MDHLMISDQFSVYFFNLSRPGAYVYYLDKIEFTQHLFHVSEIVFKCATVNTFLVDTLIFFSSQV